VTPDRPLLELRDVSRHYESGEETVRALDRVSLSIWPGEFTAIMGQSGSGKSTLMNILGCLDRPTSGAYTVRGVDVSDLDSDALAELRSSAFGFVFQRYNLLATATAEENVEVPAIYAGVPRGERRRRAYELLDRLGLGDRAGYRPSQLSGGQQQRVAIARALMNDPDVILADEPTGALDSASGEEVMRLLKLLHAEGRTIILITHDETVASHARRIVRIHDGKIAFDGAPDRNGHVALAGKTPVEGSADLTSQAAESVKTAIRALSVNLFRTALTLLGIVIGVGAVVTMLAVGNGSKQRVLDQITAMGTNLLNIRPGVAGVRTSGDNATLSMDDAAALRDLPNVDIVVPERTARMTLRMGGTDYATSVQGVGEGFPAARDWPVATGTFFTRRDVDSSSPVIVLGQTVATTLFPTDPEPMGRYVLVRNVPFEVIGVLSGKGAAPWGGDQDDAVFVPITTGLVRLFGRSFLNSITVRVASTEAMAETQAAITDVLTHRHGAEDFRVRNTASILATASETQNTLTVLLGAVAAISLFVGGIGIMNIMLVSVTERTREIGIRMATGARERDVMLQFNTEAAVVGVLGGALGVLTGLAAGSVISLFGVTVIFTAMPAVMAFVCAVATGLLFGYLPARKASRLDPILALSSE